MKKQKKRERYFIYNKEKCRISALAPEEVPLSESVILEKSIFYFEDPNPCYLHVNAVKVRLLEEIRKGLEKQNEPVSESWGRSMFYRILFRYIIE